MGNGQAREAWNVIVIPWHLDEYLPAFPAPAGTAVTIQPPLPASGQLLRIKALCRAVADTTARHPRPLLLSGDCTMAMGAVAGLQRQGVQPAIIWLDGHGDFNTPATTPTGYLGGMPLAALTGRAPELAGAAPGLHPTAERDVVLVGARDLDPAERAALAASQIQHVPADPAAVSAALRGLGRRPVYLHVDVDIIDSAQLPGLRVPAGTGPTPATVEACLAAIAATGSIAAATIACTWLPGHMAHPVATSTITRLARPLGQRLNWK